MLSALAIIISMAIANEIFAHNRALLKVRHIVVTMFNKSAE